MSGSPMRWVDIASSTTDFSAAVNEYCAASSGEGSRPKRPDPQLQDAECGRAREPMGLGLARCTEHGDGHHDPWFGVQHRGAEVRPVGAQRGIEQVGGEVVGERERESQEPRQLRAEQGRAQEPHFGEVAPAGIRRTGRPGGPSPGRR